MLPALAFFFSFIVEHKKIVYLAIDSFTLDEIVLIPLHFISDLFPKLFDSTLPSKIHLTETFQARIEQEVHKERRGADPSQFNLQ